MREKSGLHILDALENLNTLVDADSLEEIEVTDDSLLIPHRESEDEQGEDHYWVHAGPDKQTLIAIKNTFQSVYIYLESFYSKMKKTGDSKRLMEGINTIMVLVGEAAKNFEKFGHLFKQRIIDFEEYKQLQNFYRKRVIQETFRDLAKVPTSIQKGKDEVSGKEGVEEHGIRAHVQDTIEEEGGIHILNDLDVIKRDHHYELFYLKNEAGENFYTYDLARNLKVACDFGAFAQEYAGDDPLLQVKNWEDKNLHLCADRLLKNCQLSIEKFYQEAMQHKEMEIVTLTHNALMALMLAANSRNLIRKFSLKGCHLYFHDFLLFLRQILTHRVYQKFVVYSPPSEKTFFQDLLILVHQLCYHLFTMESLHEEIQWALKRIIEDSQSEKSVHLATFLIRANSALSEMLKKHPNGPTFKALDLIREEEKKAFDPFLQGNIPSIEWKFQTQDEEILYMRIPSPLMQEVIQQASVIPEFTTFLRTLVPNKHFLFINFQDKTSWKEHARSFALEELSRQAEFADNFTLVTLAKDTDFYNQTGDYEEIQESEIFIDHFSQHLKDEITGYYFPIHLRKSLFETFMTKMLDQIHVTFFEKKKVLSLLERLNFIQIAYHFIELKLIELVQPSIFALSSKDGLDVSATASIGLIALLKIGNGVAWNEKEQEKLNALLFGPTLMLRERVIHPEQFQRLISMILLLESHEGYLKHFTTLFKAETLNFRVNLT